ncbi:MAG TPA: quinone-dependent dihydroorotate dehydrogenase [Mesorhizobium sp.]|jgi:dihydroorotate dehydrogenase|nr:quinone-dependent dihydroorotate dehydrogenase [Mesorhizobium sp.]
MSGFGWFAARALRGLGPETAHRLAIRALQSPLPLARPPAPDPRLEVELCGIRLPNPLGVAAGFDKNAEAADGLLRLGFGFVEVGTVTPLPQTGNPRPRLFRLPEQEALINRLGFNNEGHETVAARLATRRGRTGAVGVNIGANKDSADRPGDYARGVTRFAGLGTYLAVNISSPNTPGLRDLQAREQLRELLARVTAARAALSEPQKSKPILLKVAPDLSEEGLSDVAAEVEAAGIEGVIMGNTTLSRPLPPGAPHAAEAGGFSGRPLFERATIALAKMRLLLGPQKVLVGVGGVDSADAAADKIRAGADLVQLYTGFIYRGPSLASDILSGFSRLCDHEGLPRLAEMRDSRLAFWADKPLR